MIAPDDVLAVVVSYNGRGCIRHSVGALLTELSSVLVVDNGSGDETLQALDDVEQLEGVRVLRLPTNLGIGHALNLGITEARDRGFHWLLTMDQDSLVDRGFIAAYSAAVTRRPSSGCLSPEIVSESAGRRAAGDIDIAYAISSGNLVRVDLFDLVGLYDEAFFIDCIDFDFSLRLRAAGQEILRVRSATMRHQLGDVLALPSAIRPFYARHSPTRRYYMYRNYFFLAERHLRAFPAFVLKLGLLQLILAALIARYDASPLDSYRAVLRGTRDYFARRLGPEPVTAR